MGYLTITELGLGHLTWEEVEPWCSLDGLKRHLIVEHDVDDELIKEYAVASWNLVETTIERSVKELFEQYDGIMPPTLIHAVRLLVGRYYAEREGESFTNRRDMSFSISALLMPYKAIPKFKAEEPTPQPQPQPQPQPEPKYTYVELAKYQDVADFLGCRICDLTEAEKKWLVSTDFAKAAENGKALYISNHLNQYVPVIQKCYGEYADRVIAVAQNRAKVLPLFDKNGVLPSFLFVPFISGRAGAQEEYLEVLPTLLDLGARYSIVVDEVYQKKQDDLQQSGDEYIAGSAKRFKDKILIPLHRYFEALCKYEPKCIENVSPSGMLAELLAQGDGWCYGSFVQALIFMNFHYSNNY